MMDFNMVFFTGLDYPGTRWIFNVHIRWYRWSWITILHSLYFSLFLEQLERTQISAVPTDELPSDGLNIPRCILPINSPKILRQSWPSLHSLAFSILPTGILLNTVFSMTLPRNSTSESEINRDNRCRQMMYRFPAVQYFIGFHIRLYSTCWHWSWCEESHLPIEDFYL